MVVEYLVSAENATVCQIFSVADLQLMRTWKILGKEHISWTGRLWANSSSFISVFTGYPIRIYCCPKSENSIFSLSNYLSETPNKQSPCIGSLSFYWSTQSGVLKNVQCLNWTIQPLKVAKLILAFYVLNCRAHIHSVRCIQYFSLTSNQHRPVVTSQPTVLFSHNKSAPATNHS